MARPFRVGVLLLFLYLDRFFVDAFGDADGTSRTNKATEVTTYALGTDDTGLTSLFVEDDGLMAAITA